MTLVILSRNRQAMVSVKHDGIRSVLYRTICRDRKNTSEYPLWAGRAADGTIPVHLLTIVIIRRPECTFGTTFFWVWTYGTVLWKRTKSSFGSCLIWFGEMNIVLRFFIIFVRPIHRVFQRLDLVWLIRWSKYCYSEGYLYLRDFYLLLFPHFFGIVGYILLWLSSYATWLGKMAAIIYDKIWFSPFFYFIILPQLQMMYIAEICIPVLINLGLLGKPTSHFQD